MSGQAKFFAKKHLAMAVLLTLVALGFRLFIALRLPTDEPDDGRLYARIANNLLDHHVYTIATEEPFEPTYIRLPGYPLFLAAVYKMFGRDNNTAVRVIQAVVDTLTCWLVAWLALAWTPAAWTLEKRRRALLIALALAAICPFLAIYVATVLTEIWTAFFATLCALAASLGLRSESRKKQIAWWALAGLAGGLATSFRPDGGLFVAAVGSTLALVGLTRAIRQWRAAKQSNPADKTSEAYRATRDVLLKTVLQGAMLTLGFAVAVAPWTVRNARVFGVFMPIAPAQANMPNEFVPRGFILWLKTWVDDVKYTETVEWALDERAIHIEQVPATAFDSPEERDRVAALLARYNKEPETPPVPSAKPEIEDETTAAPKAPPAPDNNDATDQADNDESPADDATSDDDSSNDEEPPEVAEPKFEGEMTPDIDAGFMEIATERIHRHPLRYYVMMPLRRAASLWFDTHSQYYPFQGELLPLKDLDSDLHQQYWLPLFTALTWLYTLLALLGAWVMWRGGDARVWLLMLALLVLPRVAFLSTLENPEPRYVVELFTFVMAASTLAIAGPLWEGAAKLWRRPASDPLPS
ncbi:MAG TPA: glycosyltransferase family 39 protein [Blastocatellia bacterium]|nr:glycosyltransferase family 39 protein [Blastocatellia bacterium]